MTSNPSTSYNLRSSQKRKSFSDRSCYLRNFSEHTVPEAFKPRVCLERLKMLEHHDKFHLERGRIAVKQNKSPSSNKQYLLKFSIVLLLIVVSLVYCRDYLQTNGISLVNKCAEFHPSIQEYYSAAVEFYQNILKDFDYKQQKPNKENIKLIFEVSNEHSTKIPDNSEIKQLVRDYFVEMKKKSKFQISPKSSKSFIEEQCKRDPIGSSYSKKRKFYNVTFHDMANLTDYALESEGAEIVTVFNTELYGTITVKSLNINLWPEVSHFLMKYLKCFSVNGPNSILMPWKKPGDCWAFKGSYGRVQIKLSGEIIVTAVTVEHVPKAVTSEGNIQSAPKKFSLLGVLPGESRTLLGSYEYDISGPAAQTFLIHPKAETLFRIIEVVIKSNHGNEKFTCIYKIRVHGHK